MFCCEMGQKTRKQLEVEMRSRGSCICKMRKMTAYLCADRKIQERKGNTDSTEKDGKLLRHDLKSLKMGSTAEVFRQEHR